MVVELVTVAAVQPAVPAKVVAILIVSVPEIVNKEFIVNVWVLVCMVILFHDIPLVFSVLDDENRTRVEPVVTMVPAVYVIVPVL